jgi:hypothetical protein
MEEKKLLLVFTVLAIITVYLASYNLRENFGLYKRQINGLYNGIQENGFYHWSLKEDDRIKLENILKSILNEVNKQLNTKLYYMYLDKVDVDNMYGSSKVKYVTDFFVHELKNQTTKRLMVLFELDSSSNTVIVEKITFSNAIKLPDKIFMDQPGNNLILTDDNIGSSLGQSEYHIMGVNTSNIEFSILDEPTIKIVPTPKEFNKWIVPNKFHSCSLDAQINAMASKGLTEWNVDGIEIDNQRKRQLTRSNFPGKNPSVNSMESIDNDYYWMFDLARGISAFPHGQSNA